MAGQNLMSWLRSLFEINQLISIYSSTYFVRLSNKFLILLGLSSILLLSACDRESSKSAHTTQNLTVPERTATIYVTDQVNIAGQSLALWYDSGRCQLQASAGKKTQAPIWLQPIAPCFFMKSPGTDQVQVYQRDKTNRVLAVIGSASEHNQKRCGAEVQGVVINAAGALRSSNVTRKDAVFCADQGLDNLQYELFAKD